MSRTRDAEQKKAEPLTLHTLDLDDAMAGFLQVDPEKVKEADRKRQDQGDKDSQEN